jgi:hypothetical protein
VSFSKIILNPKDWIIVLVKKTYNYILRAEVIEPIVVKGELVDKANDIDLLLNNLLISGINNIKVIIKKKP